MNKKISILLFFLFVLISMSAVSAVDADGNNDTIVSSADAGTLALANDVDAIDDLDGNYSDGDTKALSSDAKSVAVGKNEIYGATYEEAEGDSMSPMLGDGYYNININFDSVYNPEFTFFFCDVMGPDMPSGTLDLWIDNSYTDSFRVDNGMCSSEIHSLDAGDHTWYAEFIPDGGGEKSTEERSFTIDQDFAYVYINDPGQSSIEMGVGESRNFWGHVNGPESSEVNISSSNDNVAKFRASSSSSYVFEGYIDAVGAGTATITVSFAGNKNYKAAQSKTLTVTVIVPSKTIYVNATANQGGDGNQTTPFQTLQDALDIAEDGDTIMIASGTYTGENNTDLTINNNLTFEKYGEGEAIFDAQELSRIWTVTAATINITGLTFKNGKITANSEGGGAAIYIENVLSNSIINASFINNVVVGSNVFGGAILFEKAVDNVEIYGEFINNTVDLTSYSYGGAISFKDAVSNSIINATFADNSANKFGGAIYFDANKNVNNIKIYGEFNNNKANSEGRGGAISFREDVSNSIINALFINNAVVGSNIFGGAIYFQAPINNLDITGKFINNTGKDVIYIGSAGSGNEIHDAVFLNNAANKIINIGSGSVNANVNWFGNNATNYNETPANVGIDLDNWLFLNATANPSELELNKSSTVAFKLYNKNSPDVEYDASKMNIVLDLAQTLGELDKDTALIGEEISYTSKDVGTAGVTGKFETASYTVSLKNVILTNITLENTTFNLKVNDEVSSGATLNPAEAGNLTYTSSNPSVVIVENGKIRALANGIAVITVSFAGNDIYAAAQNRTIDVTVSLRDAKWTYIGFSGIEEDFDGASLYLPLNYAPDCFVRDADGIGLPAGTDITIFCEGNNNYTITTTTQEGGLFNVDVSGVEPYQVYMVSFSTEGYTSAIASVYVIKTPTEIIVANATVDMKVKEEIATGAILDPSDAGNLSYTSSDSGVAIVEDGKIVAVGEGSAIITVSFAGNDIYAAAQNRTIGVTVIKVSTVISADDVTVAYKNTTGELVATIVDVDGEPLSVDLNVVFNGDNCTVKADSNGQISMPIGVLSPGTYTASISYAGDDIYAASSVTADVVVTKADTVIAAQDVTVDYGDENAKLVATLKNVYGNSLGVNVNVDLNGESYTVKANSKGQVFIPTASLAPGNYTATISYAGNVNYNPSSTTANIAVNKVVTVISAPDVSVAYKNTTGELVATIVDVDGEPLSVDLNVVFNGDNCTVKADSDGQISVPIGVLSPGTYEATISFDGDDMYAASSVTADVVVTKADTVIAAQDVTVDYGDENAKLVATLKNVYGNSLGVNVNVDLNGESYTVKANSKGQVFIPTASLAPGNYTATISYAGNVNYNPSSTTANIAVNKVVTVISAPDVSVAYKNTTGELVATVVDVDGEPLSVDLNVVFNGDNCTVKADSDGQISVPIGVLSPGTYEATISFDGDDMYAASSVTADVTVAKADTVITAEDVSITYKDDAGELVATIKNVYGNSLGVNLNVNFNGENYTIKADSRGRISIPIGVLTPGTYEATISYAGNVNYNPSSTTVNVVVSKMDTVISAQDVSLVYKGTDGELSAVIKNVNGNSLGVNLNVNFNGENYTIKADSRGKISLPISSSLTPGNYTATISYAGNVNYNPSSTTVNVVVDKADTVITANDVTVKCGDEKGKLVATLKNEYGNGLGVNVNVNLNGQDYTIKAESSGKIVIPTAGLAAGSYVATISYKGNGNYNPTSTTANVIVKP